MICDRCYKPLEDGHHGQYICPLEPRRAPVVRPDSIPGGVMIAHGICNEDGSPKRYDSRSEIAQACAVKNVIPWTEVFTEDRTKDARVHDDWLQSSESRRARRDREELRHEKKAQARRR